MGQTREKKPSKKSLKAEVTKQSHGDEIVVPTNKTELTVSTPTICETEESFYGDLIEVKETEDRGLAVFANRRIPAGTLLLLEAPLIRLTKEDESGDVDNILSDKVVALPKNLRSTYLKLYDSKKADFSKTKSIYFSNCYNLNGDRSVLGGSCIGAVASRINHSCVPNVQFSFQEPVSHDENQSLGMMRFYAIKTIARGKEICSNYDSPYATMAQRQHKQQMFYGFKCQCEACTGVESGHEFWSKSDDRRREMIKCRQTVGSCEKDFERGHVDVVESATTALQKLEVLVVKEGLTGRPLAQVYSDLSRWSLRLNGIDNAIKWLHKEREVCVLCYGRTSNRIVDIDSQLKLLMP